MNKPLFIPLKKEFFEKYKDGSKNYELRKPERHFQLKYLWSGRHVILSCGYSGDRIAAKIIKADLWASSADLGTEDRKAWLACYGQHGTAVMIHFNYIEGAACDEKQ